MSKKSTTTAIAQLSIVNGVNAPFVSKCVEFATISQSREQLAAILKAEFAAILSSTGVTEAVAAKQLAASLATALDGVVSSPAKRASEILVAIGIRQRGAKAKSEGAEQEAKELAATIEALVNLAKEQAGEKAVKALRRAYLSVQAENSAE
jgi:hypothetical protein